MRKCNVGLRTSVQPLSLPTLLRVEGGDSRESVEQQFNIRSFQTQVQQMNREQAQEILMKLYEQMIYQEATYKHLLKHDWGLEQLN
ncbi:NblA/ycf18 family protein [Floridanema evergladense]|uniref:NblA/ycf18 family protein n=1 Tax=Floridaenema evergladense BLCC-F167 TaxID=3153639 RepID=A0ABV4WCV6_9CYAN